MSDAQKPQGASLKHDISVPVQRLDRFVAAPTPPSRRATPRCASSASATWATATCTSTQPAGGVDPAAFMARTQEFAEIVHDLTHQFGGSISAEHGLGRLKVDEITRYHSTVELDLKRRIKQAFDPRA
ncbi:hypothetical protein D3874_25265 [Oleomonas cavernae]|uniref:FAD-binding oxidoreductase/transferase type 4 C-terminal domain-containing protein n=2 Tax=Oleomonas cavernae TaxID=2320859 RepID=A0A418VTG5_9PROT|nr:hypothetical protein D3874_25265 [Oleomonas cavernae]